jgi:hypothetical protein
MPWIRRMLIGLSEIDEFLQLLMEFRMIPSVDNLPSYEPLQQ